MVTIIDYRSCVSLNGNEFFALTLQGEVKVVQSEADKFYMTADKMSIATSFNEIVCQSLIGKQLPGNIEKVECDEYQYTNRDTGETVTLSWKYQYTPEEKKVQGMQTMQTMPINPYTGIYQNNPHQQFQHSSLPELVNVGSMVAEA